MKKTFHYIACAAAAVITLAACSETETYAEQKEYEYECINNFLYGNTETNKRPITVITEATFKEQGETTDTARNEFVLFNSSGIYMQIVEKGCGEKLKDGESADVLCRYYEYNLNGDSLQTYNNGTFAYATTYEKMSVRNTSGTFSASFTATGRMLSAYGNQNVPSGWLVPLTYIKLGRPASNDDKIAHVRLIVPHDQGQVNASTRVYACYYDITYERGL